MIFFAVWYEITRPQYWRDGLRYASDTTDEEWAIIAPLRRKPAGQVTPARHSA